VSHVLRRSLAHLPAAAGLALIALACAPSRVPADDRPPLRPAVPPYFSADAAVSLDSTGRAALGVSITVPFSQLQWIRVGAAYACRVEFMVVFEPKKKGARQYGDIWEERLGVPSFSMTNSSTRIVTARRTFQVAPGKYRVRVAVRDHNAGLESVANDDVEVRDYTKEPVGFADLELGLVDSAGFTPVPTRRFGIDVSRLATRAVLFDRRPGDWPRSYSFRYRIQDENGAEVVTGESNVSLHRSAEPVVLRPHRSDLFLGAYVFEVELVEGRSRWVVERSFEVEESGPPRGREFQRMLEPLSYIAEADEIEYLRALPEADQARGWDEFWKRRDPTPETQRNEVQLEFFRRVRHAETHFQGFGPGWRSDMGRIYIRHGPPDQIETRPSTAQTSQLEIWYYNTPYRRFIFVDREGFGRYVLAEPENE
jgi:GWxTD domain-containing protein